MGKYYLNLISLAFLSLFIISCKKNSGGNPGNSTSKIYIVGSVGSKATLWTNNIPTAVTSFNDQTSEADAITGKDNDIYIVGSFATKEKSNRPYLWHNGLADTLPVLPQYNARGSNACNVFAYAVALSGSDVYVGGAQDPYSEIHTNLHGAVIWKNGTPTTFGQWDASIRVLSLSGSNIYGCGSGRDTSAHYYLNNVQQNLNPTNGICNAVAVSGNDIYVVGEVPTGPNLFNGVYWKNGVVNVVAPQAGLSSAVVKGKDLYISGSYPVNKGYYAGIWKNGDLEKLETPSGFSSICDQVRVFGNDVYGVGMIYDVNDAPTAVMWKNGALTKLTAPAGVYSYAFDIYINQ